ncbi:uncharacterized protein RCO7_14287 [Rhynchosporium graminicola]|uniref:Uncharacterized protein n=1 Tax=Rhynchosporium graminicola TaxID=2792576 RepID=A0A1E1KAC8_9HELO|nr:uncharacterized protein RCO7_14287 [Rhynchosporium commune]
MSVLPEFIQYVSQMETRKYPSYVNLVTNPAHENYRVYGGEDPTGNQSGKLPEVGRAGDSRAASSEVDIWVPAKARKASSTEPRFFSPYLLQLEGDLQRGITSGTLSVVRVQQSNYKLKIIKRASIDKAIEVNI